MPTRDEDMDVDTSDDRSCRLTLDYAEIVASPFMN